MQKIVGPPQKNSLDPLQRRNDKSKDISKYQKGDKNMVDKIENDLIQLIATLKRPKWTL